MIIDCPNCNKNFDIDQNLIPIEGRLLQCGSCNHKWFFKLNVAETQNEEDIKIKIKSEPEVITETENESLKEEINTEAEYSAPVKKKEKIKINYLNILLVITISIIAFILILDTFKNQLTSIYPDINVLLNNLYLSIEDIKLFLLDLIK